jgi:SET domain-containing protein
MLRSGRAYRKQCATDLTGDGIRGHAGGMMLIRTRVAPSAIHGMGLFVAEAVAKGTPVWHFEPGFDRVFSPEEFAALPPLAREHLRWYCFVSMADKHLIKSGDHACFMNHSPAPNTGSPPDIQGSVTTVALRDIAAGEELTCDYASFDADTAWKLGLAPRDAPLGATPP